MGAAERDGADVAPVTDRAAAFARAASDRPPPRPRPTSRSATRAERRATWTWITVAVVGALLFVVLIRGVFEKTKWTAGRAPRVEAMASPLLETTHDDGSAADAMYRAGPCAGVVEHAGGVFSDGCAGAQSAAERLEQQHRAEEAIRLIEATTPEAR